MKKTIWLPIVISLIFAFLGWLILIAGFSLPIPGLDANIGVSEIFNLIAAILGGPITVVIGNILFGIFGYSLVVSNAHPWPISFYLTLADVVAHIISLILVSFCYRYFYERAKRYEQAKRNAIAIASWILISIVYYFVLIPLQVTLVNLVIPGSLTIVELFRGTLPEILATTFITTLILLALPKRYRRPLWYEPQAGTLSTKNTAQELMEKQT
jgi:hypothetical protein